MAEQKLKRNLSFISMIALASGAVIGGWLAEAPYWFSVTGAGAAVIFPILAILLIPIGLTFSELTAMLPFASSVDIWTTSAFGHKTGFAAQWTLGGGESDCKRRHVPAGLQRCFYRNGCIFTEIYWF